MEITTGVPPSSSLYGLGEFTSSTGLRLTRDGLPRAMWTRDQTAATPDINTYGAWPFVMEVRPGAHAPRQCLQRPSSVEHLSAPSRSACPTAHQQLQVAASVPLPPGPCAKIVKAAKLCVHVQMRMA